MSEKKTSIDLINDRIVRQADRDISTWSNAFHDLIREKLAEAGFVYSASSREAGNIRSSILQKYEATIRAHYIEKRMKDLEEKLGALAYLFPDGGE